MGRFPAHGHGTPSLSYRHRRRSSRCAAHIAARAIRRGHGMGCRSPFCIPKLALPDRATTALAYCLSPPAAVEHCWPATSRRALRRRCCVRTAAYCRPIFWSCRITVAKVPLRTRSSTPCARLMRGFRPVTGIVTHCHTRPSSHATQPAALRSRARRRSVRCRRSLAPLTCASRHDGARTRVSGAKHPSLQPRGRFPRALSGLAAV